MKKIYIEKDYELCYFLNKDCRGNGYMTEVVDCMKKYLFQERNASSLTISVFPRNDASRRIAIKNGFTYKCLERKCGITGYGEIADLERYAIHKKIFSVITVYV